MFTGLIESMGQVDRLIQHKSEARLYLTSPWEATAVRLGDSVSVNGACLTIDQIQDRQWTMDVSGETLACTNLNRLVPGKKINLERALPLGGRLDGHLVSGHVDCIGQVTRINKIDSSLCWEVTLPPEHIAMVAPKGSIALEGVSLTVNQVQDQCFTLNLIPHTLNRTTLRFVSQGDYVNIETDLLAKYLHQLLKSAPVPQTSGSKLDRDFLTKYGF